MMTYRIFLIALLLCSGKGLSAQRPDLSDELFFPPMPVGAQREQDLVIRGLTPTGQYNVVRSAGAPFRITSNSQDLVIRNGEIRLRVVFEPTRAGDVEDMVELEREPQIAKTSENRIKVKLYGSAFWIERAEDIDFGIIDVADSARRLVLFRSGPADDFEWEYTRAPNAPFRSTTVQGPFRRGRDTLAFLFSFSPTSVGRYADTVGIIRKLRGGQRLDTAWMYLRGAAKARPYTLRPELSAPSFDVRIGDTMTLDVKLVADGPIDIPEQVDELTFDMSYNPTVLVPLRTAGQTLSVRDGKQILTVKRDASNGGPLTIDRSGITASKIVFVVALGDAESTSLTLDNASYSTRNISGKGLADQSAAVNITNVWRYQDGRPRLANPLQGVLVLDIDPNPVVTTTTMRVRNLPTNGANLIIVDASGVVVADLTTQLRAGVRDFTVASSGNADVMLSRGTYVARLAVESEIGGTLLSVVRIFIVQ